MPFGCSVPNCQGNYKNGPKVSVFSFPENEIQRQKWIRAICRDGFQPTKNSKVCILHFQQQDVERETSMFDSKTGRLLTAPLSKPRLVKGAVPSVFPMCPLFMKKTTARREDPEDITRKENEQMSQSSNECSSPGAVIIKEEPVLNDWESTDGISSATDPPSIKKEEFSPPEDIRMPSASSVDGMEAEGDDGGSWSDDCVEEIEVEVDLRTDGIESESAAAVDAEDSNSVQDSDGSVTKHNAPYGNESATGNVEHRCAICRKVFANFEDLKEHTHEGSHEIPHSCSICCRSFKRAEHLQKHFRVHTGERPYSCKICSRKFAEKSNLKRHLRVHTGERPYSCLICNKTFLSSTCLKRHSQMHTGERPYSCSVCNKAFSTSTCLKRHSQMHLDKPPYNCDVCPRQFKEIKSLRLHYRTHMRV